MKVQKAKTPSGFLVSMQFSITQHVRDELLLIKLIDYLGCGKIEKPSTRTSEVRFVINRFSHLIDNILPNPSLSLFREREREDLKTLQRRVFFFCIENLLLINFYFTLFGKKRE